MVGADGTQHPSRTKHDQWLHLVLYLGIAALLTLSICYYRLRVGLGDTPFYIINMVLKDGFTIEHNRFVCILFEWLPVMLIKLGASMKAVAIGYSLCYMLTPMLLAILAIHWLKQPYTALAIILLFTLMNSLLFYYIVSELHMGLALLIFLNGLIDYCDCKSSRRNLLIVSALLIVPTIAFSHPMATPTFACWLLYRILAKKTKWRTIAVCFFCFTGAYLVKSFFFVSAYEAGKQMSWEYVRPFGLNYYTGSLGRTFLKYILDDAFLVPVVLLFSITVLVCKRKLGALTVGVISIALLYTVVIIAFENLSSGGVIYEHYYEHYLQASIVFLIFMFIEAIGLVHLDVRIKAISILVILTISLTKIIDHRQRHIARQRWESGYLDLMSQQGVKKAALSDRWVLRGEARGNFWTIACETLLLSSLDDPQKAKTLFVMDDVRATESLKARDLFLVGNWSINLNDLSRYFQPGHQPYLLLDGHVPDSTLEHMMWR